MFVDIMHVVDVVEDNGLNEFYFDYSCDIFGVGGIWRLLTVTIFGLNA